MQIPRNFKCLRCGNCCRWSGYVRLSTNEVEQIAAFLKVDVQDFTDQYCILTDDRRGLSLCEDKTTGACIFFIEDPSHCLIEEVKPQQCRDFPHSWRTADAFDECEGLKALDLEAVQGQSAAKTRGKS